MGDCMGIPGDKHGSEDGVMDMLIGAVSSNDSWVRYTPWGINNFGKDSLSAMD